MQEPRGYEQFKREFSSVYEIMTQAKMELEYEKFREAVESMKQELLTKKSIAEYEDGEYYKPWGCKIKTECPVDTFYYKCEKGNIMTNVEKLFTSADDIEKAAKKEINEAKVKDATAKLKGKLKELDLAKTVVANVEREIEVLKAQIDADLKV